MRYYGPFQITEQIKDISFRLRLPDTWKIHNLFHVNLWKTFGDVPDDGEPDEQPEVEANEEILVPEQVLAHKVTKKRRNRGRLQCFQGGGMSQNDDLAGKEQDKEEKIVTLTKKGRAVLDNHLPDHIKSHFHVLETDEGIYDAMLNQTNVGDNNNKFYVIQVLESDDGRGQYYVYNRWGRVGARGQDKLFGIFQKEAAIQEFEAKFTDKTRNIWAQRANFEPVRNKYTWLERDYSDDAEASESKVKDIVKKPSIPKVPKESKLDSRLGQFISCICNVDMMKQQMMEIGYDANKMPLGKLSKATILKGYEALKRIAAVLEGSAAGMLERLSSEFYTVIPHDFGFQRMSKLAHDKN
ncbi:hypothetical protein L7F22_006628 [Adiantum nelumboides]|nr:hypothetical protein [Adiantum nelumboides]